MNAPVETLFMGGFACGVAFTLAWQAALRPAIRACDEVLRTCHRILRRLPRAKTPDPRGNGAENGDER